MFLKTIHPFDIVMFSHRVILRLLCLFKMTFKVYTIINTCKRILWKLSDHTRNQILLLVRTQFPKGLGKNEGLGNDLCQSKKEMVFFLSENSQFRHPKKQSYVSDWF